MKRTFPPPRFVLIERAMYSGTGECETRERETFCPPLHSIRAEQRGPFSADIFASFHVGFGYAAVRGRRQESGLGIHSAAKERHSRALNTFQLMTGVGEAALWFRGIQSLAIKKRVLSTKISPLECSAAAFRSQSENLPSASSVINLRQRTEKADCCPDPPSPSDRL